MHRTMNDRRIKALEQVEARVRFLEGTEKSGSRDHARWLRDPLAGKRLEIAKSEHKTLLERIR